MEAHNYSHTLIDWLIERGEGGLYPLSRHTIVLTHFDWLRERETERETQRERGAYTPFRGTQLHSQFERERERKREREGGVTSIVERGLS